MMTDLRFYFVTILALMIIGISKGGFGGGLGILGVPLMALVIPPQQAAAILLPVLCVMDIFGVWLYRGKWSQKNIKILLPPALLGIGFGVLFFRVMDINAIRVMVGSIAVSFTLDHWFRLRRALITVKKPSRAWGWLWGSLSGFTSFIAHAGGPPISVFLLPQNLDKTMFVGTTAIFFAIINYAKLIPYGWLGLLDTTNLTTSLILVPLAPLSMALGLWLHHRISDLWFYRFCYSFVFLSGVKLLWDGIVGFM
ncbi:MAG: sulfite exporter TauE/SafE family protein [Alphaproteobacteria bacterium]